MKRFLTAVGVVIALAGPAGASTITDVFTSFFSFGDSLTDDGKFGTLRPPSFEGRWTNGQTWSEYIEDEFAAAGRNTANFALGGATAGDINLRNPGGFLATFNSQISAFAGAVGAGFLDPGSNPLVSVWFGANDIFQGFSPVAAADAVLAGIRTVASIPTHSFDNFLVMMLPDIPGAPGAASAFNGQLASHVAALRDDGVRVFTYDPANALDAILADYVNGSPLYGITNLTTPCTDSLFDGTAPICSDPEARLLVDAVHPNATVHQIVGEQVRATISAELPLPASLPLLVFAVGGIALIARRRRAA